MNSEEFKVLNAQVFAIRQTLIEAIRLMDHAKAGFSANRLYANLLAMQQHLERSADAQGGNEIRESIAEAIDELLEEIGEIADGDSVEI